MELLERESFLDTLDEYADQAAQGHGRLVVLAGEAGIGKTSLVDAFRVRRPELRWLAGTCDGGFTPRPLGPLYEIAAADGDGLLDLVRAGADRNVLFGATLDRLSSGERTAAVVVEDVHWADEATLDWLTYLARRLTAMPTLVVLTYRDEELTASSLLRSTLAAIATQRSTRRMTLPPLTASAVAHLIAEEGRDDVKAVYALTGGNPFYVHEVLAATDTHVPASVMDLFLARTARLADDARQLLWAAAVLARPASASEIAAVAGRDPADLDDCLSSGGLVTANGHYTFRHELVRRAVEAGVPAYRRTQLHHAAYDLERETSPEDHAVLAHHADGGHLAQPALEHALAAAAEAARLSSSREAVAQYERAARYLGGADAETQVSVNEGLATSLSLMDHWQEAFEPRRRAVELVRATGDRERLSANLRALANTSWRLCDREESDECVREVHELMADAPLSEEKVWALNLYAGRLMEHGRVAESEAMTLEVLALARDVGSREAYASVLQNHGLDRIYAGEDSWDTVREALRLSREGGFQRDAARGYANLYQAAVDHLRIAEYEWCYAEGDAYNQECEMPTFTWCLRASRGTALLRLGRLTEAVDYDAALLREHISPINRLHALTALVPALVRLGSPEAPVRMAELRDLAVRNGEAYWSMLTAMAGLQAAWLAGTAYHDWDWVLDVWGRGTTETPWMRGELALWMTRCGRPTPAPDAPEHLRLELDGDPVAAATAWERLGCPFETAAALAESSDPADLRRALDLFTQVGSAPGAALARRRLKDAGAHGIPRGPRATTTSHPHGLTAREQQVLTLVGEGLSNRQVSTRLFISERTVDHHVAAVLAKLGAASRTEAVELARADSEMGTVATAT